MTIFNIFMGTAAVYLGAKYCKIDIDGFIMQQIYNIIFFASYMQIIIKNNKLFQFIETKIECINNLISDEIEVILFNRPVYTMKMDQLIKTPPAHFDLIIYSVDDEYTEGKTRTDKVILYDIPSEKIEYKKCNYRFIQVSLIVKYNGEENIYKVELSNTAYNYYIANNKLNSKFVGYYLNKHCNAFFDMDDHENINYKTENKEYIII